VRIAFARTAHLQIAGEHGIGRRQSGPQEQRCRQRQAGQPPAEQGNAGDAQRHGDKEQASDGRSQQQMTRVDLEPRPDERDHHDGLGQPFPGAELFLGEWVEHHGVRQQPEQRYSAQDGDERQCHVALEHDHRQPHGQK
jgi:hypothetical protein